MSAPRYFAAPAAFRAWLEQHAEHESELLVGFHKVDSGKPSMSWSESVDEALCFGWIDGVRKRIDEASYSIRFTPRKPGSIWSAINIAKVETLRAGRRMTPAGERAFAQRIADRSVVYAYEQTDVAQLTAAETQAFRRDAPAWAYWEGCPPGYRKTLLHWVTSAKRAQTRAARLATLIDACRDGKRLR